MSVFLDYFSGKFRIIHNLRGKKNYSSSVVKPSFVEEPIAHQLYSIFPPDIPIIVFPLTFVQDY